MRFYLLFLFLISLFCGCESDEGFDAKIKEFREARNKKLITAVPMDRSF